MVTSNKNWTYINKGIKIMKWIILKYLHIQYKQHVVSYSIIQGKKSNSGNLFLETEYFN